MESMLSTKQVAERLGVDITTVIQWIKQGRFPNVFKVNPFGLTSPYRIPEKDILAFEEQRHKHSPVSDQ